MKYLVNISFLEFLFDEHGTADTFAAVAKAHYVDKNDEKPVKVYTDYLTDEEAAEYEKGN